MASTTLSPTSCTASIASCPLAPTSDTTPSTFDFARFHATLPLAVKMSVIWVASRVTSSRSACRSAWISPLAAEAALPLSRAASLTSRAVSRAVSRTVSLIVPDVLDMDLLHSHPRNIRRAANGAQGKKFPSRAAHALVTPAVYSRPITAFETTKSSVPLSYPANVGAYVATLSSFPLAPHLGPRLALDQLLDGTADKLRPGFVRSLGRVDQFGRPSSKQNRLTTE